MLTLIEQLDKGSLWRAPGGIHPPEIKSLSNCTPIGNLPLFDEYLIPLPQLGDQAVLAVGVGDRILKGQPLTHGIGPNYLPAHAPTSGTVIAVEQRPSNHPSALPVTTLVLACDGQDEWCELTSSKPELLSSQDILARIRDAGIAGMGGAAFPSHIKLSPASEIELFIVNGVECEPYITADDRLMREHAIEIMAGIQIVHRLLGPKRIIIAIEDNKPDAITAMKAALLTSQLPPSVARVSVIPTLYPSGGEKQLIQILTGQEVPSGAIPAQLGMLVHNVGTLYAIQDAVIQGKPLIERIVTVTGQAVGRPGNYRALLGTQVQDLLDFCQFRADKLPRVIMGGPMMGYTLPQLQVPLLKGSNCVLAPRQDEIAIPPPEKPCIRCGECALACPASLLPQQLFWHASAGEYDKAESYHLRDCIECGCCSYVCPSDIPLVEYYRVAKAATRNQREEKLKAERAKERFEARITRLEEEKIARETKARQAAEKRKATMDGTEQDAIAAALARVKAKKSAQSSAHAVSAAMDDSATTTSGTEHPKLETTKAGVAAAIARAKAKKAAQQEERASDNIQSDTQEATTPLKPANPGSKAVTAQGPEDDPRKAAVAAAIARAKAKRAAQQDPKAGEQAQTDAPVEALAPLEPDHAGGVAEVAQGPEDDPRKAAVAAAIARAKAKKAALQDPKAGVNDVGKLPNSVATSETVDTIPKSNANAITNDRDNAADASGITPDTGTGDSTVIVDEKAASANGESHSDSDKKDTAESKKNARIAAAVAKAKAKKAGREKD